MSRARPRRGPIHVVDGVLVGGDADLLTFDWASVLIESERLWVSNNGEPEPSEWRLDAGHAQVTRQSLLEAEVRLWSQHHRLRGIKLTSLSGASFGPCDGCGEPVTSLADRGPATGYWWCEDFLCGWTEIGPTTNCGNFLLTFPWPAGAMVEADRGASGGVYVRVQDEDGGPIIEVYRTSFEEAEHVAFETLLARADS